MISRIKYEKDGNMLVSKNGFRINDIIHRVYIDLDNNTFSIAPINGSEPVATGSAVSLFRVQLKIRKTLSELGFNFRSEERKLYRTKKREKLREYRKKLKDKKNGTIPTN